jgi:hypothetical protein
MSRYARGKREPVRKTSIHTFQKRPIGTPGRLRYVSDSAGVLRGLSGHRRGRRAVTMATQMVQAPASTLRPLRLASYLTGLTEVCDLDDTTAPVSTLEPIPTARFAVT